MYSADTMLTFVVSLVLMASLPWTTWERLLIWMAIGIVMYFAYGSRHSRLRQEVSVVGPGLGTRPRGTA